ncbi:MAG: biosynthetic-type acetolactate synthase large subunit [Succinivibrio sp.]|nr:biosynthetic-type acetolactate synthase large subunit [Succinivibrio sp.]MDY5323746.1 biosynthetic-type acetolactate synthase large subunit [Succinivibrio sp.]
MEKLNGAQQVVRVLEDLGVTRIFGYPGAAVTDIYDELYDSKKIVHTLARHEQGAVHMADGYARSTGKVGVSIVTSGPGATNTVTALATAYGDSIPLVLITGQVSTDLIGTDAFQEVDTMGVTRPVVKYSFLCKKPEDIAINIRKAFYIASTGRKGPVVVDIPKNCQNRAYLFDYDNKSDVHIRAYNPTIFGHKGQIKRAVAELLKAKQPVMLIGGGVVQGEASAEVLQIAKSLNLPVVSTLMGISGYPASDPQYLGMLGMHGLYEANETMHNSDLIFAVGTRFADRATNKVSKFCPNATIIHIDVDPASISKTVTANIPIVGDAKTVLTQILTELKEVDGKPNADINLWWDKINVFKQKHCLDFRKKDGIIRPQEVIQTLSKVCHELGINPYVTTDVGQHQMFTAQYFKFEQPRHFITSGGLGTMGLGFPAAIGAQFANPHDCVICISGDGSFQMNMQELAIVKKYKLPVKVFILDNSVLGMVRQFQTVFYHERYSATNLDGNPNFVKLVEAYDLKGIQITDDANLEEDFKKILLDKDNFTLVDVITDTNTKVMPWLRANGSMVDMMLNDEEK